MTNYFLLEIDGGFSHCRSVQMEYTVPHFLDPQAKGAMTERLDRFDLASNTLVNTLKEHVYRDLTLQPTPHKTSSQNIEDFSDVDSLMATLLDNHHTQKYETTYASKGGKISCKGKRNKVDKYLAEKTVDIMDFCRGNEGNYPMLARLAEQVLAIPASSVTSERVFSIARIICT